MAYKYDFGQVMQMSHKDQLAALKAKELAPRWIVGTGYKNGRKVAIEWLEEMIAKEGKNE